MIAQHDVEDVDHWLAAPTREELFSPLRVTNIRTFVDQTNPTLAAVRTTPPVVVASDCSRRAVAVSARPPDELRRGYGSRIFQKLSLRATSPSAPNVQRSQPRTSTVTPSTAAAEGSGYASRAYRLTRTPSGSPSSA